MSLNKVFTGAVTNAGGGTVTTFGTQSAKTVIANATNATAAPTAVAAATARHVLRNNSGNTGLEWGFPVAIRANSGTAFDLVQFNFLDGTHMGVALGGTGTDALIQYNLDVTSLLAAIDSTSIVVNSSTLRRAALTGAIAASENANTTVFSGILNNGSATTDRTSLNFIGFTIADDAGNDRINITAVNQPDVIQSFTTAGTSNDVALNAGTTILRVDSGNSDWSITGFARSGGNVDGDRIVVMNASNNASTGEFQHATGSSAGNQLSMVGSATQRGRRRTATFIYDGADLAWREVASNGVAPFYNDTSNVIHDKVAHNGTSWELTQSQRKSRLICEWHEDFCLVNETSLPGILFMGDGTWFSTVAGSAGGSVSAIAGETDHPGICRLTTHTVVNNMIAITKGSTINTDLAWVQGQQIRETTVIARCGIGAGANTGFFIGFTEQPGSTNAFVITGTSASNIMGFLFDTAGALTDTTVHAITREADGTAVNTDTNITPGSSWHAFTIRQYTLGTVEFLIDGSVVATHSSQVPDTETVAFGISVITRTGSAVALDVDFVSFESQPLSR